MPALSIAAGLLAFLAVAWTAAVCVLLRVWAGGAASSEAGMVLSWLLIPSLAMAGVALVLTIANGALVLFGS